MQPSTALHVEDAQGCALKDDIALSVAEVVSSFDTADRASFTALQAVWDCLLV